MASPLVRPAVKAGSWYPASPDALARVVDAFVAAAPAGGAATVAAPMLAGLVPHAGFAFSGAVAARTFAALQRSRPEVATIVVLGAVHTAWLARPAAWAAGAWDTPLGAVEVDGGLAAAVIRAGLADDAPAPHYEDNAIELQLPFIRRLFPRARLLSLAVPPAAAAPAWGARLAGVLREEKADAAVIASSDLTHYGAPYGFAPAGRGDKALRWAKKNDAALLATAARLAAEDLVALAERDHSACGAGALAMMTACARELGAAPGEILCQTTSYEVMPEGEPEMFVGYGALTFRAGRQTD